MISEETARELIDTIKESIRQDRLIRANEYFHECMQETNRFALSPTQREYYKSILDGTDKPHTNDWRVNILGSVND